VHEHFEEWIREEPQDWFCSKRMWPRLTANKTETSAENSEVESDAA